MEVKSLEGAKSVQTDAASDEYTQGVIVNCIRKGLSTVGDSSGYAIEFVIKIEFGLPIETAPENPTKFVTILNDLFGMGARILEENILQELSLAERHYGYAKCNCPVRRFSEVLAADLRKGNASGVDFL